MGISPPACRSRLSVSSISGARSKTMKVKPAGCTSRHFPGAAWCWSPPAWKKSANMMIPRHGCRHRRNRRAGRTKSVSGSVVPGQCQRGRRLDQKKYRLGPVGRGKAGLAFPSLMFIQFCLSIRRSGEIKTVVIHHLCPCLDEVGNKLVAIIILSIDLGNCPQL